jgi:hypothetical protein
MANFQFTVRATDSDGAYADRNFGITVNNTRVERYMVIDSLHAYTSPDLVNWTQRNNQGGWDCIYGNGMWLVISNNSTPTNEVGGQKFGGGPLTTAANSALVVRRSVDGVNYTTSTQGSGAVTLTSSNGPLPSIPTTIQTVGRLSFSNGYFWLPFYIGDNNTTSATTQFIARSADGLAWQLLACPAKSQFFYGASYGLNARNYTKVQDSGSDIFIANFATGSGAINGLYGWKSSDLGVTWTAVQDSSGKANGVLNYYSTMLTRINGLWIAGHQQSNDVPFMISNDGVNWQACNPVSGMSTLDAVHDVVYANGTLYAISNRPSSTATVSARQLASTDGINWTLSSSPHAFSSNGASYQQYTSMFYKNGYLVYGANSASATTSRAFSYVFAGSGDSLIYPAGPAVNTVTGPQVPFNYINGMAAMGS